MELHIIRQRILEIRGYRVILEFHLAELFGVENRALKQAVKRNTDRFPSDFMLRLTSTEVETMVSQNVIPSKSYFGGSRLFAFTEQGVAMLSSILRSKKGATPLSIISREVAKAPRNEMVFNILNSLGFSILARDKFLAEPQSR